MAEAIVFAGGIGLRIGAEVPKQFIVVAGKPILVHTLGAFQRHRQVDKIRCVVPEEYVARVKCMLDKYEITKCSEVVCGGVTAQKSIYNGLAAAAKEDDVDTIVLIHDGVRPNVSEKVITDNIRSVEEFGCGITVVPCNETVLVSEDGHEPSQITNRKFTYIAQAPQSFRLGDILAAHRRTRVSAGGYTDLVDQATLCKKLGMALALVRGNDDNIKVTFPNDILMLEELFRKKRDSKERRRRI